MGGIRNYQIARCLVLAVLLINIEGKTRPSTKTSLQKIKTNLISVGKNVLSRIENIEKYLDSEEGSSQIDAVSSSLEAIGEAVPSLTSGDTAQIMSGTLDVISAATPLIPLAGPIISTMFSLIGTIFGSIAGSSPEDIGTVVKREIETALNNYDDSLLRREAWGTYRVYANSQAYLAKKEDGAPIQKHELSALTSNVPVYNGIGFLGKLVHKVEDNVKSGDPVQVKRAMEYMQLYVTLAVLRSAILWEMYALVRAVPDSSFTADAIKRYVIKEESHDERFLSFLLKPDYPQAVFFAYFNPSEWKKTMLFMRKKGMSYQRHDHLAQGTHTLRPEKWTDWYMYMYKFGCSRGECLRIDMAGTKTLSEQSRFTFHPISREDNLFYVQVEKWPFWYAYMTDYSAGYCRGYDGWRSKTKPGPAGEWKVIRFKDGKYMLSPRKWPNWFIYMDDSDVADIKGWTGDPGKQGHWLID